MVLKTFEVTASGISSSSQEATVVFAAALELAALARVDADLMLFLLSFLIEVDFEDEPDDLLDELDLSELLEECSAFVFFPFTPSSSSQSSPFSEAALIVGADLEPDLTEEIELWTLAAVVTDLSQTLLPVVLGGILEVVDALEFDMTVEVLVELDPDP
jgi:hypothetical protein